MEATKLLPEEQERNSRTRTRLGAVRRALLKLHKALLDDERIEFERVRGRIASSGEFLQLVLNDEWFAYLRPLSALVVQIDELLDDERIEFERVRGRIASSGEFLQLVLNDEWFAYLRPLSALVVQIDELLDA